MKSRSGRPCGNAHKNPQGPIIPNGANVYPQADDFASKQHRLHGDDLQQQEKRRLGRGVRRRAIACYSDGVPGSPSGPNASRIPPRSTRVAASASSAAASSNLALPLKSSLSITARIRSFRRSCAWFKASLASYKSTAAKVRLDALRIAPATDTTVPKVGTAPAASPARLVPA
jgi:hypothetical protein